MNAAKPAPGLYLVATPIGTARDITLRALDLLKDADVLAAEDTRNTRKLMNIHGIPLNGRKLIAYHDHNGDRTRPQLLDALKNGQSVAYVSDAGTPMVADPGFDLARAAIADDLPVYSAPGPSALLAALCVSGLPTDRFCFAGFAPNKTVARKKFYAEFASLNASLAFFESPKRICAALQDMCEVFGKDRQISVCRELTKKFEEIVRGTILSVSEHYENVNTVKGELVVILGPPLKLAVDQDTIDTALRNALKTMKVKDAASTVADKFERPRKEIYARALEIKDVD